MSNLTLNKNAAAILHAVATLGRNLSIETTAEGVETEAQLEAVVALGCTEMQGNLFSHARPAAELVRFFPKATALSATPPSPQSPGLASDYRTPDSLLLTRFPIQV